MYILVCWQMVWHLRYSNSHRVAGLGKIRPEGDFKSKILGGRMILNPKSEILLTKGFKIRNRKSFSKLDLKSKILLILFNKEKKNLSKLLTINSNLWNKTQVKKTKPNQTRSSTNRYTIYRPNNMWIRKLLLPSITLGIIALPIRIVVKCLFNLVTRQD